MSTGASFFANVAPFGDVLVEDGNDKEVEPEAIVEEPHVEIRRSWMNALALLGT